VRRQVTAAHCTDTQNVTANYSTGPRRQRRPPPGHQRGPLLHGHGQFVAAAVAPAHRRGLAIDASATPRRGAARPSLRLASTSRLWVKAREDPPRRVPRPTPTAPSAPASPTTRPSTANWASGSRRSSYNPAGRQPESPGRDQCVRAALAGPAPRVPYQVAKVTVNGCPACAVSSALAPATRAELRGRRRVSRRTRPRRTDPPRTARPRWRGRPGRGTPARFGRSGSSHPAARRPS
jgi:hypothetical protein